MKNSLTTIIILAIVVALGLGYVKSTEQSGPVFGAASEIYSATTTDYTWTSTAPQGKQIKLGTGVLGSVIIGNATAVGTLTLYDATTTVNGALYGTTTLAVINTGMPGAAIPYNISFNRGLLAVMSATLATSTITFD